MISIRRLYFAILTMLLSSCADITAHDMTLVSQDTVRSNDQLCAQNGVWIDPSDHSPINPASLFKTAADSEVILLGESHTSIEHHRWQLHSIAALHAHQPNLILGFEMFPRSVQSILDKWVKGELNEQAFLEKSRWDEVWRYDPELYLPLFHFARLNNIPMIALNVERSLVQSVSDKGWAAVPTEAKEGVGDPAPASEAYQNSLARLYLLKQAMRENPGDMHSLESLTEPDSDAVATIRGDLDFQRFVQAQSTWDRAMAESLAQARQGYGANLALGIMGRGHVEYGYGVANQLQDLGLDEIALWLPVEPVEDCGNIEAGLADAVFIVPQWRTQGEKDRPLLGVSIEAGEDGVNVSQVAHHSVAMEAGIHEGDIITEAAGLAVREPGELIEIIQRQAPGTWLPLSIHRDGKDKEIIAKFPPLEED